MRRHLLAAIIIILTLGACSSTVSTVVETTPSPTPTPTPTATPTPKPTDPNAGKVISSLTGLYIDKEAAARRPAAVVINNAPLALPQSGISQADIYYEVLSEGGITRIISIFQDFDSEKIGPVRSARHYFLYFALDHDAVFVHHGGSQVANANAYSAISKLGVNNLDGMRLDGILFKRDPERYAVPRMREHSSYISAQNILQGIKDFDYRAEKSEDHVEPYLFYEKPTSPKGGLIAEKITVPFSYSQQSVFEYDKKRGLYMRSQNGSLHIDEETGGQLSVTNVIIQNASIYTISGDDAGRQDAVLIGSGDGYLATNGTAVPITWSKADAYSPTQWYGSDGKQLTINKGKTWICVFQKSGSVEFEPEEKDGKNENE